MNVKIQNCIVTFLTLHLGLGVSGYAIAIGGPFKCGTLKCPNGSLCEITQQPNDDCKSVTIHTQCKSATGEILQEETITKELPEGKIPVTSLIRKTVSGRAFSASTKDETIPENTAYSTDGRYSEEGESVDFVPLIDSSESDSADSESLELQPSIEIAPFHFESFMRPSFGNIWSLPTDIFQSTRSFINNMFDNFFCKTPELEEIVV